MTYKELKLEALNRLHILKIVPAINALRDNDTIYLTDLTNEKTRKIKIVPADDFMLYHIIKKEQSIYFLKISNNPDEWAAERRDLKNGFAEVITYDLNAHRKHIGVETKEGKITRIV